MKLEKLNLKIKRFLIDQVLSENFGLDDIMCLRAKNGMKSSVNRQISFRVKI